MIFKFGDYTPVVHPTAFVHPQATVTGNVIIGADVYIGPSASLRGDFGAIILRDGCNVQDNCTIHMFPGVTVLLEEGAHIGHGAIIHGAQVGKNVLVGMNAVVMDEVKIGEDSIIGALSFVKAKTIIPAKSLFAGNPGKVIRELSEEQIKWKAEGSGLYRTLPDRYRVNPEEVEPLSEVPENWKVQDGGYSTWKG
ncbi:MAG: phenylacetic acid degradation protein [Limisphaerales bacterium]|jgi:phenylacetic acid degradation protein